MTERLKVAGYIRVSTPSQAHEGESLSTQTDQISQFVKMKGWKLIKLYEDRGLSGAKADTRPGFMAMIEDASKGAFQGIVFSRLSRFARSASDFLKYQKELKVQGISLFSIKEGIDPSTKMGEFAMKLMSLFAEWERETLMEQMYENKMIRWRDGRTFVGKPPYGYVWNREAKRLEINEKEAGIYREIVKMYTGLSLSMKDIAIKLGDRGLKAKRKPFGSVVISDILKNPAYYGNYVVNRFVYVDGKRMDGKKDKKLKPESEHISFNIPPLISKKEWDAIQSKTAFNKTKSKRSGYDQRLYWLRDLLVCGECGGVVKPHHGVKRKDGSFPRYYTCYWSMMNVKTLKLAKKKERCHLPNIRAERLEVEVWNAIMRPYLFHSGSFKGGTWIPSKMGEALDSSRYDKVIKEMGKTVESLQADLKRLSTSRERILDLIEDERFNKDEMAGRLNRNRAETLTVEGKIKEAQQRLTQAEQAKKNDGLYRSFLRDKKSVLRKLAADLQKLSPDDRKRLAEGSVNGKVKLVLGYDDESDTFVAIPKLESSPNMALVRELMEEGKIGKLLCKDGSHDPTGYEF